jgi:hypothetical protein
MDTNIVLDFKMIDNSEADIHNETCTKVDHKINICSHNATSRHSNNKDKNKIYAISSGRAVDNYTQLVSLTDMDRPSNNYRNPPKTSHNRLSTAPNLGGSEDGNQGNNPLNVISTVGSKGTYNQVDHLPDASNISSHFTSGTSEHYLQEDYANDMGRQNIVLYNDNTDTNTITGINTVNMSAPITYQETYHQADHILDNRMHNNISSQSYNRGNNQSNTIYSDNYIHRNNPKNGKEMIITISTGGYRDDHSLVGHILDNSNTDSQSNQMDNNMINNYFL